MNQSEYAAHRGVSQQLIARYIRDGKLDGAYTKHGRSYLVDPVKADELLNGGTPPTTQNAETDPLNLTDERARLAKERADAQEIKNAVARGEYLPKDEVAREMVKRIVTTRNRLLAIPNQVGQHVFDYLDREQTAEVVGIVDREVRDALTYLAEYKP